LGGDERDRKGVKGRGRTGEKGKKSDDRRKMRKGEGRSREGRGGAITKKEGRDGEREWGRRKGQREGR